MRRFRDCTACVLAFPLVMASTAVAQTRWTTPTAAELSMTSEPKDPGAPAIVLSYEESEDADSAEVFLHVRIKVLTSGGLSAANLDLPSRIVINDESEQEFAARTIHSDGTIILFRATPQNTLEKSEGAVSRRILTLPDVEVGSILEYICHYRNQNTLLTRLSGRYSPLWRVQGNYFVRSAHFSLKTPYGVDFQHVRWVAKLPPGTAIKHTKNLVELEATDVPAMPDEAFSPPLESVYYHVRFFYYGDTREKYWGSTGDDVDKVWSPYYEPRKVLVSAVHDLVLPADTDEQKLRKIYAAVMRFDNSDLSRRRSRAEDKKSGLREVTNSEDIWLNKRGDSSELTFLFIALARAAGYPAYPIAVASRDHAIFDQDVLSWAQMDSMLAIVNVKGHEVFFDPGTRMCPFNHLAPWHANVIGVSSEGKLIKIRYTPQENYTSSHIDRQVNLTLSANSSVSGTAKISWAGTSGLLLKRQALREDKAAVEATILKEVEAEVPRGVELKLASLTGLEDSETPLVAEFTVAGGFGSLTRSRILLPTEFFESSSKPVFESSARTLPVNFTGAYSQRDLFTLQVPPTFDVESTPAPQSLSLKADSSYKTATQSALVKSTDPAAPPVRTLISQRIFVLGRADYAAEEYPDLHTYFSRVAASDREQVSLSLKASSSPHN